MGWRCITAILGSFAMLHSQQDQILVAEINVSQVVVLNRDEKISLIAIFQHFP
jgi:hypothetical protein